MIGAHGGRTEKRRSLFLTGSMLVAAAAVLLGGCSGEQPRIFQQHWRLDVVAQPDGDNQFERLTLFVQADDADGMEDLAALTVTHPQQELRWSLDAKQWSRVELKGESWFGGRLRAPGNAPEGGTLPRGRYRVVLEDRAGEHAEDTIFIEPAIIGLTKGPLREKMLPSPPAEAGGEVYYPFEEGQLKLLNEEGEAMRVVAPEDADTSITRPTADSLAKWSAEGARTVLILSYGPERGFGVVRGPYSLERLGTIPTEQ